MDLVKTDCITSPGVSEKIMLTLQWGHGVPTVESTSVESDEQIALTLQWGHDAASWKERLKGFALELNPQQLLRVQLPDTYWPAPPIIDLSVG
jgi:hypothetical protein